MSGTSKVLEMLAQEKHRQALERLHRAIAQHDSTSDDERAVAIQTVMLARAEEKTSREQWLELMMDSLIASRDAPTSSLFRQA